MLTCNSCGENKHEDYFHNDIRLKSGKRAKCKDCYKETRESYRKNNKEKIALLQKTRYVEKNYGISLQEYNKIMESAVGCEICEDTEELVYDHCHKTGDFRGVLCSKCNRAIGLLGDDLESIIKVMNYLKGV
jgi:hypothetical protein